MNDEISLMMNESTDGNVVREPLHKTHAHRKMAVGRFVSACLVEESILEDENKNTAQKTERDVRLIERFSEMNEFVSEFIISLHTKDGNEHEAISLRSLVASFERHLKKQGYSASITNELVFEKTRKVLQSKQKQVKKQGKGNKPKESVALTSEELKILYEKGLLGMCGPEALSSTLLAKQHSSLWTQWVQRTS